MKDALFDQLAERPGLSIEEMAFFLFYAFHVLKILIFSVPEHRRLLRRPGRSTLARSRLVCFTGARYYYNVMTERLIYVLSYLIM